MDPNLKQLVATVCASLGGMGIAETTSAKSNSIVYGFVPGLGAMWLYGNGGEQHAKEFRDSIDPVLFPMLAGAGLYGALQLFAPKKEKKTALLAAGSLAVLAGYFNRKPATPTVGMLPL